MVIAPVDGAARLIEWTWSYGDHKLGHFANYALHAAKASLSRDSWNLRWRSPT